MIKKAMILGAGFGKRLNPLTLSCPKPLLSVGEETLLSNTINFLEQFEIKEIVINVHYLANQIIAPLLLQYGVLPIFGVLIPISLFTIFGVYLLLRKH